MQNIRIYAEREFPPAAGIFVERTIRMKIAILGAGSMARTIQEVGEAEAYADASRDIKHVGRK